MKFSLVTPLLFAGLGLASAQVTGDDCGYLTTCFSCLTYGSACSWDAGLFCNGGACTEPDHCVTPNFGGGGDNKTAICELPQAQPPAHGVVCAGFTDCNTCLSSENCAWSEGNSCVEQCETGKNCVTPHYGGMGSVNKNEICALPEARNPTPEGGLSCGTYTNCQACLAAGYSFSPTGCAWSRGSVCTQTCPGGDATTCVTPNYGNTGANFDQICALPAAQVPKAATNNVTATADCESCETDAANGATYMISLLLAGIAAFAL